MSPPLFRLVAVAAGAVLAMVAVPAMVMLAVPAVAQQTTIAVDRTLPIEIEADSLEAEQSARLAVFSGNVKALQGQLRLSADKLQVYYGGGAGVSEAEISRIDAEGRVFFSTNRETAQGDRGTYDVENGIITLTGAVVLTRGDDVIRGRRVVLNLTTGRSTVNAGDEEAGDGRVRGLFIPRQPGR